MSLHTDQKKNSSWDGIIINIYAFEVYSIKDNPYLVIKTLLKSHGCDGFSHIAKFTTVINWIDIVSNNLLNIYAYAMDKGSTCLNQRSSFPWTEVIWYSYRYINLKE